MRIIDQGSEPLCVWCGKGLRHQEDVLSRFIYTDRLCIRCRNRMKLRPRRICFPEGSVQAFYPYAEEGREMLLQYKELGDEALGEVFLWNLRKELRKKYREYTLVPVPSTEAQFRKRGFHHVEKMFRILGLPVADILEKKKEVDMKEMRREERRETGDFIGLKEGAKVPEGNILVADDLVTTGATLRASLHVFRDFPVKTCAICVFYHPDYEKSGQIVTEMHFR